MGVGFMAHIPDQDAGMRTDPPDDDDDDDVSLKL
jgi:hypothetical protein